MSNSILDGIRKLAAWGVQGNYPVWQPDVANAAVTNIPNPSWAGQRQRMTNAFRTEIANAPQQPISRIAALRAKAAEMTRNRAATSSAAGAVTNLPPNYLKNQGMLKGLRGFAARHPRMAGWGGAALLVGGSILGGNLIANQKKGDWYQQGHQAATRELGPMVTAMHAPQGAMSLPSYARPR